MSMHGYEGASISAIIKESGIQKSSIYWQFDSKAAIAAAVMERGARRFFDAITIKGTRGNAGARLRRSLREVAVLLDEHQEFLRLFLLLLITNRDPDVAVILDRVRTEARVRMHELVEIAFEAEGPDVARAVADRLAGFGDPHRRHLPGGAGLRRRGALTGGSRTWRSRSSTTEQPSPQHAEPDRRDDLTISRWVCGRDEPTRHPRARVGDMQGARHVVHPACREGTSTRAGP
jgi:AcrR family transcriptional regulator